MGTLISLLTVIFLRILNNIMILRLFKNKIRNILIYKIFEIIDTDSQKRKSVNYCYYLSLSLTACHRFISFARNK